MVWPLSLKAGQHLHTHTSTHLFCQFAVLVDVSHFLAAEVGGCLGTSTAVHREFRIAAVVVTVARGGLTLVHGVILGRPLQRREALCMPAGTQVRT